MHVNLVDPTLKECWAKSFWAGVDTVERVILDAKTDDGGGIQAGWNDGAQEEVLEMGNQGASHFFAKLIALIWSAVLTLPNKSINSPDLIQASLNVRTLYSTGQFAENTMDRSSRQTRPAIGCATVSWAVAATICGMSYTLLLRLADYENSIDRR